MLIVQITRAAEGLQCVDRIEKLSDIRYKILPFVSKQRKKLILNPLKSVRTFLSNYTKKNRVKYLAQPSEFVRLREFGHLANRGKRKKRWNLYQTKQNMIYVFGQISINLSQ